MNVRLKCRVTINGRSFNYVKAVNISSTWKRFTDTASIEIPNRFLKNGQSIVAGSDNVFKRGDKVKIELCYFKPDAVDGNLKTEFTGYISKITPASPFRIDCEDEMFLLKQKTFTKSWKSVNLKQLIGDLATDIPFETVDAELGSFRITRVNVVQVLDELKKTYGLTSFMKSGKLYVGVPYTGNGAEHDFDFNKNIITDDLQFVRDDDVKIKVTAISMLPSNKKIQIETGDSEGDNRTLTFYNLTESELKNAADREISKLKYTGWRGSFTTFGAPKVVHGDTVNLTDKIHPERSGKYFIEGVDKSFGLDGFRQIIHLGAKA